MRPGGGAHGAFGASFLPLGASRMNCGWPEFQGTFVYRLPTTGGTLLICKITSWSVPASPDAITDWVDLVAAGNPYNGHTTGPVLRAYLANRLRAYLRNRLLPLQSHPD